MMSSPHPAAQPDDNLDDYLGLPAGEAETRAGRRGWRIVRSLPPDAVITMEFVAGRLNFTVRDGRVSRAWPG